MGRPRKILTEEELELKRKKEAEEAYKRECRYIVCVKNDEGKYMPLANDATTRRPEELVLEYPVDQGTDAIKEWYVIVHRALKLFRTDKPAQNMADRLIERYDYYTTENTKVFELPPEIVHLVFTQCPKCGSKRVSKRSTRIYVTNYAIDSDEHKVKQLGEPYTWPEWEQFDSYFCSDCLEFFQEWDFSKYNFDNPEYIKGEDAEAYREAHKDEEGRKKTGPFY